MKKHLALLVVLALAAGGCSKPSASSTPPSRAALAGSELSERVRALLRDPAVVRASGERAEQRRRPVHLESH